MAAPALTFAINSSFTVATPRVFTSSFVTPLSPAPARHARHARVARSCPSMVVSPELPKTVREHNTTDYPATLLTVRRGQPVDLAAESSALVVTPVSAGSKTRGQRNGPEIRIEAGGSADGWALESVGGGKLRLSIPDNASVGLYTLDDGVGAPVEIAVVFNPFLPADPVHMPDKRGRIEYVFNETGLIWRGSASSNYPAPWDFAQFDEKVVLASLFLLDLLDYADRADPVAVTRYLSAVINSNDEGGVLVGRWDGEYDDGTPPSRWTGSGSLLRQFYDDVKPIKYGQCWVFAGLLTTVCRALGIPTRVTSNFSSAHDTTRPYNRAVDRYFDEDGDLIESKTSDSIWNFHVWCDAWMRRPDLASAGEQAGFSMDGWQAIDATPQELSEGRFQMGPSPLLAVKNGYAVDYDTDFVIGEVNADVLFYWQRGRDSDDFVVRNKRTRDVGKFTSTKEVGTNARNDITLQYKHPEGSDAERAALANRAKPSDEIEPEPNQPRDVVFEQKFEPRVRFGDDIRVVLTAKNKGATETTVRFSSLARAIRYTGEPTSRIDRRTEVFSIAPGKTAEFVVTLPESAYQPALVRDVQTIKFDNSAKVAASGQTWAEECIVRVYGDDALDLAAPSRLTIGDTGATATVTVTNEFRVALTNVVVTAEGRGLAQPTAITLGAIEPGASKQAQIPLRASVAGERTLVVTLDTEELQDIVKSASVMVVDPSGSGSDFVDGLLGVLRGLFD